MKITDLSVKRPVTVIVVCLALAVLGVFSLGRLAIDLIPNISFPVIVIFTSYPGVSPEEVGRISPNPSRTRPPRPAGWRRSPAPPARAAPSS